MNLLLVDKGGDFLDFALRCREAGHSVKWFIAPKKNGDRTPIGDGFDLRVPNWQAHTKTADLILTSDNTWYMEELYALRKKGFPVMAPSPEAAALELNRGKGQESFERAGLDTMPSQPFTSLDDAIAYVTAKGKRFVSKPDGDMDKALSYVSQSPRDMLSMLMRWKRLQKGARKFILQEFVPGIEMAVGGWFGPGGFNNWVLENFEFKKLMNDNLGCNCYSEDTEVLTNRGWLRFNEVTLEDEVASYDPKTDAMFFERPTKLYWTRYDGPMVNINNRYVDLFVTPSHNMWLKRRKTNDWRMYPADLMPSESTIKQAAVFKGEEVSFHVVPEYLDGRGTKRDALVIDADKWWAFMGLFLSEGYASADGNRVVICQEEGAKKTEMLKLLSSIFDTVTVKTHELVINSVQLNSYLTGYGTANHKFSPGYIKEASPRQINIFLDYFLLGDGDIHDGRRRFCSGSWRLISDIQEMLQKVGSTGVISTDQRQTMTNPINGKVYRAQPVYAIEESTRTEATFRGKDVSFTDYHGMIGCVTVPTTHLLFVRRNGRVAVSGNTGEQGTVIKYVQKDSSLLFKETLAKVEDQLHRLDYCGYVDISVIIDSQGKARPLEYTMRLGWPCFQIQQALHREPVEFMKDLLDGRDTLNPYRDTATGVVLTIPDFPYSHLTNKEVSGYPVYGLDGGNEYRDNLHPCSLKMGLAPSDKGKMGECMVSAGDYLLVASGTGSTVEKSKKAAYRCIESVEVPNSKGYRTDISDRLEDELPILHKQGYAKSLEWN